MQVDLAIHLFSKEDNMIYTATPPYQYPFHNISLPVIDHQGEDRYYQSNRINHDCQQIAIEK